MTTLISKDGERLSMAEALKVIEKQKSKSERPKSEDVNQKHNQWDKAYQEHRIAINKRSSVLAKVIKSELNLVGLTAKDFRTFDKDGNYIVVEKYAKRLNPDTKKLIEAFNVFVSDIRSKVTKRLR